MKQIVYLAMCSTIDGVGNPSQAFASLVESERDSFIESSKNKPWLYPQDMVADLDKVAIDLWERLLPIEQLAMIRTSCPMWQLDYGLNKIGREGID